MILVFIFLGILIFLLLLIYVIFASTIKMQIYDLYLSNRQLDKKNQYHIKISLYLWKHFKWLSFSLDKKKINKIIIKIKESQINIKKLEQKLKLQDIKVLRKLKLKIEKLNLEMNLGLESPIATSFIIAGISSTISILLPIFAQSFQKEMYQYKIAPIYQNKNLYEIKLNCIIILKVVHIINVILILIKKGKSDKNERATSNRKSYGYSYE